MKKGTRLYINITNHCNLNCPFCCMYSGTDKRTFMSFPVYRSIIDHTEGLFELQLEGGEPLLHPKLFLFLEYAVATKHCMKIILLTNGMELESVYKCLMELHENYKIPILIKVSINYYILMQNPNHLKMLQDLYSGIKSIEGFELACNVRKRKDSDDEIEALLERFGLADISNVYYLQAYGKLTGSDYEQPVIVQNIENWKLYASDGTCFGTDLIGRSEHERELL